MATGPSRKDLVWLTDKPKTPPLSAEARQEAGQLLRLLQQGESLGMPHSRPMPGIGPRCHELRIRDRNRIWRVAYRLDPDVIVIAAVFSKTTTATSKQDLDTCRQRLRAFDDGRRARRGRPGR